MRYEAIVELLGYASGQERQVRITTTDNHEVIGIPTSVDPHPTACEVYLHPKGDDGLEIAISLAHITRVEMA
jgi:hypothetical protein